MECNPRIRSLSIEWKSNEANYRLPRDGTTDGKKEEDGKEEKNARENGNGRERVLRKRQPVISAVRSIIFPAIIITT